MFNLSNIFSQLCREICQGKTQKNNVLGDGMFQYNESYAKTT